MHLDFEQLDGQAVLIRLGRVLDYRNAEAFKAACQVMLEASVHRYVIDCSACRLFDSTGLGALFWLYRRVASRKGKVVLAAPSTSVEMLIERLRLEKIFEVYSSVKEAHRAFEPVAQRSRLRRAALRLRSDPDG